MPVPISLIITTYNRERYLSAAIESILAQTSSDFELLIWDDGSTDGSVEIARNYAKQDTRVKVVAARHRGRTPALKVAIAQTTGTYIGLVDSDDILAPTALEETAAILDAHPATGLVYTDYLVMNDRGDVTGYGSRCRLPYSPAGLLRKFMTFHFRLIRRTVFEQVGGINESFYLSEDYELCLRLSEVTQVQRVSKPLYYYRVHRESISQQQKAEQNRFALIAIKQARKRRQHADNFPVTLPNCLQFSFGASLRTSLTRSLSSFLLAALPLLGAITVTPALAQIVPAADGTNTLVNTTGNQLDITGGQTSSNGTNLFHSFSQFDLNAGQTANFQSNATIQNILGRVVSGNASNINGLIQVSGSQANLYLMNPAGIIFGSNASLNVPASFVATSATSIGMGNNWFNAAGSNDYTQLNDTPNAFAFTTAQPGSIVNSGNLAVGAGKDLMLLGGTVVSTGQVNAPSGQITMAAVPGTSLVRLSQPGSVLSLEVLPPASSNNSPTQWTLPVLSLPQLLTGGGGENATGIGVNASGQAVLTGSGVQVPSDPGITIISGTVNVSGTAPNQTGGEVNILGDKVGLVSANIDASGTNGGGTVLIGGDYQGKGTVPNASRTYVSSDSVIKADSLLNGNGGRVIVWADDTARIYGTITAQGGAVSGNGGFVETSGKHYLDVTRTPELTAPNGTGGTWLLDPSNITIQVGSGTLSTNPFIATTDDSSVDVALINAALSYGIDVTISTNNPGGTEVGNIIQNAGAIIAPTTPDSGQTPTLTLRAANNIVLNGGINVSGGLGVDVNLIANDLTQGGGPEGNVQINANIVTNRGTFTSNSTNFNSNGVAITTRGEPVDVTAANSINVGAINVSGGGATGSQTMSLTGNEIDFTGGANSLNVPYTATLRPATTSQNIVIGGTDDSGTGLDITASDLNVLATAGLDSLDIGRFDGSGAITIVGSVTLPNSLRIQSEAGSGSITATAPITLTSPSSVVELRANQDITTQDITTSSLIRLVSNVGSINTSTGTLKTSQGLGADIELQAGGSITPGNLITNTGYIALGGPGYTPGRIILSKNVTFSTTGSSDLGPGLIVISGSVDGPGTLTVSTSATGNNTSNRGALLFEGGDLGRTIPLGGLNVINASKVEIPGNITTTNGDIIFNSPVTLTGTGSAIFNAGTASISFNNNLTAGTKPLTLIADTGINLPVGGSVTGSSDLQFQPFTSSRGIVVNGSGTGVLGLTNLGALADGFNSITIGRADESGAIALANDVTFTDPLTIQAPVGSGTITATGTITGLDNASITLRANQNITTSNITANPGITLISSNGTIDTSAGILDSSSTTGNGGVISLSALGNIATNNLTSDSDAGAGGDITLNSQTGAISSGNLDASGNTAGGKISVIAQQQITAGQLNSSAITGDGGNVLLDPIGDIQVDSINSQGGTSGKGGNVDITTNQFFRAVGNFSDRNGINASISTAGGTGGGDIIIRHDGGARNIPFVVGNAATNGTAGAITTSLSNSILPDLSFSGAYTQGNIQLITQNPPPSPSPSPLPSPTVSPSPSPLPSPTVSLSPQPDTAQVSKDIQGENLVPQGINTISASAFVLLNTTSITREGIDQAIASGQIAKAIALIEQLRMQEFQNHFEGNLTSDTGESGSVEQTQAVLSDIAKNTGKTPAVIYVFTQSDQLQLILVTPRDKPLLKTVYQANKDTLLKTATKFRSQITEPRNKSGYQATAKQLYQWLLEPLEAELQAKKIDTLVFSMDGGLRSIPMAALSDGKQFLVEKYSIGLIPSLNLTDTRYQDVKTTEVLAMGASKFSDQDPLPAVPVELSTIVGNQHLKAENRESLLAGQSSLLWEGLWSGEGFLNQGFTLSNLKAQRTQVPFGVIHLATHGQFNLGAPRNSYIQLWDTKLRLDQLRQMGWNNPSVELLVLSACRTALGNEDAEFGFGGLAVAAGVKSALASLWYVSDEGTLALMSKFYERLKRAPIKAEALREAQIAMIKGQVRIEGGKLRGIKQEDGAIPLPPELAKIGNKDLEHPYYWSAFTMIGSPW